MTVVVVAVNYGATQPPIVLACLVVGLAVTAYVAALGLVQYPRQEGGIPGWVYVMVAAVAVFALAGVVRYAMVVVWP